MIKPVYKPGSDVDAYKAEFTTWQNYRIEQLEGYLREANKHLSNMVSMAGEQCWESEGPDDPYELAINHVKGE